jgi:hypothetical protein
MHLTYLLVDNGHLVAWTAKYSVERIQAGGLLSGAKTDEGLVCRCAQSFYLISAFCDVELLLDLRVLVLFTSRPVIQRSWWTGSENNFLTAAEYRTRKTEVIYKQQYLLTSHCKPRK